MRSTRCSRSERELINRPGLLPSGQNCALEPPNFGEKMIDGRHGALNYGGQLPAKVRVFVPEAGGQAEQIHQEVTGIIIALMERVIRKAFERHGRKELYSDLLADHYPEILGGKVFERLLVE